MRGDAYFGLVSEQSQTEEDTQCDYPIFNRVNTSSTTRAGYVYLQCLKNNSRIEEGSHDSERECFHKREDRQQDQVQGMAVALPVQETENDDCAEEWYIECPEAMERLSGPAKCTVGIRGRTVIVPKEQRSQRF